VILIDDMGPSYLVALEKSTGKNLWKADRKSRSSWTSPVVASAAERTLVFVSSTGTLDVYDAANGTVLATQSGFVGNNIPSPTVAGNLVLLGAGENRMKPDLAASSKSNCCLRLVPKGAEMILEPVWEGQKMISHHASPVANRDHAYFVTKPGLVHCIDLKTGVEQFAERLENPCWATPIVTGEYVYFFGKDGITTVLKAGPTYEKVATNRLWSAADFGQRQEAARANAAATLPKPPAGKGPGGGPPLPKEELEATRYSAVGDVVYGIAAGDETFYVRTGNELMAIRTAKPNGGR
ncbi:MAG: PQQ-binding-like beta-propeller repeat protein, partial [Gemmataceae bacterium]